MPTAKSASKKSARPRSTATNSARVSETRVQHAESADEAVTPARIAAARARLPAISDHDVASLSAMHTDAEYVDAGKGSRSAKTLHEALGYVVVAEEEFRKHPALIDADPVLVTYLDHTVVDLESTRSAQRTAAPGNRTGPRDAARSRLRKARTSTLKKLRRVAGGNDGLRSALDNAIASATDDEVAATEALVKLGRGWIASRDAHVATRVRLFRLTPAVLDALSRAAQDLADRSADALGTRNSSDDSPEVNLAEGKVLYTMKTLYELFEEAHEESGGLVRRLVPGSGTQRFVAGHQRAAGTTNPGATSDATQSSKPSK